MNIAILTKDFNWAGGIDFLYSIFLGLKSQQKQKVKFFLLIEDFGIKPSLPVRIKNFITFLPKRFKRNSPIGLAKNNSNNVNQAFNHFEYLHEIFKGEDIEFVYFNSKIENNLEKKLNEINADILFPILFNTLQPNTKIKWVGYMFDFVFKKLPHLYTEEFGLKMDIAYANTLLKAKSIIVNSQETKKDIVKYFPYANVEKVFALPFAPYIDIKLLEKAMQDDAIKSKYNIHAPYFIISNQFWLHKDHETAFRAIKNLTRDERYKNVELICTGKMTDLSGSNERENYLRKYVSDLGIKVNFLGHIPKVDQIALMLKAIALVQPTKFEGGPGGGSVYMALACGVQCLVSNIDVNLEIGENKLIHYFNCENDIDLSEKMKLIIDNAETSKEQSVSEIIQNNRTGLETLGNTLLVAIEKAIKE